MALTKEQFSELRKKGLSTEQIIQFESGKKPATTTPQALPVPQPPPIPEKGPGFLQNVAQDIANPFLKMASSVRDLGRGVSDIAQGKVFDATPKEYDYGYFGKVGRIKDLKEGASVGFKTASTILPAAKAPAIANTTISGLVKQGLVTGVKAGVQGGALYGAGAGLEDPNATLGSVAKSTVTNAIAGGLAGGAFGGALAAPASIGQKIQQRFFPTATQATNALKGAYDEVFTATKTGTNKLEKSMSSGKNPSQFLAQNGITIDVTPDNKINTKGARDFLQKAMDDIDDNLQSELADIPENVMLDDIMEIAKKAVDNKKTKADGTVLARQEQVEKIFNDYKKIYGAEVPPTILNEIKRGQRSLTNVFDASKPKFAQDVHYQISKVAMKNVEDVAKKYGKDVAPINTTYGDHIDATKLLKSINGQAVKGGKIGKYFSRLGGSIVGSTVGNATGGPLGGMAGAVAGDMAGETIQRRSAQNAILPPMVRKAIDQGKLKYQPLKRSQSSRSPNPANAQSNIINIPKTVPPGEKSSSKLPTQNFAGGFAGIEQDENGNWVLNEEKALAGMVGVAGLTRSQAIQKLSKKLEGQMGEVAQDFVNIVRGKHVVTDKKGMLQFKPMGDMSAKEVEQTFNAVMGNISNSKITSDFASDPPAKVANLFDEALNAKGAKGWTGTESSKPSKVTNTSTNKKPTGKEGALRQSVGTSGDFDGYYHGSANVIEGELRPSEAGILGKGFYVTKDAKVAESFAQTRNLPPEEQLDGLQKITDRSIKPNLYQVDTSKVKLKELGNADGLMDFLKGRSIDEARKELLALGFDGISLSKRGESVVFPESMKKIKTTLTDIWKKANKK